MLVAARALRVASVSHVQEHLEFLNVSVLLQLLGTIFRQGPSVMGRSLAHKLWDAPRLVGRSRRQSPGS